MIFAFLAVLFSFVSDAQAAVGDFTVTTPEHGSGLNLDLSWTAQEGVDGYVILRSTSPDGPWELITSELLSADETSYPDKVTQDPERSPPADAYSYRVASIADADIFPKLQKLGEDATEEELAAAEASFQGAQAVFTEDLVTSGDITAAVTGETRGYWLNLTPGYVLLFVMIVAVGVMMNVFAARARRGEGIFIRRISGIDAIEEGIGRATEMGRPVLYVPGIDELQDIQTIASMLILGQVAEKVAEYQSDLIVSCCIPIVREVADEVVKAGFYQAGYPDAYNPANTRFISSEQFAFCAGTNGVILREKPSTNIYFGRFFAESLILAETGFVNRSIQIAGTAEATQLPFFIAACDYTLIGEELFAVSAYLSRDPRLISSLKASDWVKVFVVVSLVIGTILATLGIDAMITLYTISK